MRLGAGGGRPSAEGGSAPAATGVWPGGGAGREGGAAIAGREVG